MSDVYPLTVKARELGREHGRNAAEWWIQETLTKAHDSKERARMVIAYDESDHDPSIPTCDLSGQWADDRKASDILDIILGEGVYDATPDLLIDEYEDANNEAAREQCLAACGNELAS
jgi:hypothetical protein